LNLLPNILLEHCSLSLLPWSQSDSWSGKLSISVSAILAKCMSPGGYLNSLQPCWSLSLPSCYDKYEMNCERPAAR